MLTVRAVSVSIRYCENAIGRTNEIIQILAYEDAIIDYASFLTLIKTLLFLFELH